MESLSQNIRVQRKPISYLLEHTKRLPVVCSTTQPFDILCTQHRVLGKVGGERKRCVPQFKILTTRPKDKMVILALYRLVERN